MVTNRSPLRSALYVVYKLPHMMVSNRGTGHYQSERVQMSRAEEESEGVTRLRAAWLSRYGINWTIWLIHTGVDEKTFDWLRGATLRQVQACSA